MFDKQAESLAILSKLGKPNSTLILFDYNFPLLNEKSFFTWTSKSHKPINFTTIEQTLYESGWQLTNLTDLTMSCLSDEFLNNLVNNINASTHIKDVGTGKYVNSNEVNSKVFNLNPADIIGMNICDLDNLMKNNWDNKFIPQVVKLEQKVIKQKTTVNHIKSFLRMDGIIRLQNMVKIPILGKGNNVLQIFTISENIVNKISLLELWDLYKNFYSRNIKKGIEKFLLQTGVSHLFTQLPTEAELMIIILNVIHKQPGSKYICKFGIRDLYK